MYTIKKSIVKQILNRKFNSVVGVSLEQLENLSIKYNVSKQDYNSAKEIIKKITYEAMREIESQIDAFSQGVSIGVDFIRPTKE